MKSKLFCTAFALVVAIPAYAESFDATAVLRRAEEAMGAANLRTLRYTASGSAWQFGQGYKAGAPWPKLYIPSYTRVIDYEKGASREDVVRTRAELTGGGAIAPAVGAEQRLSMAVSGTYAWNQAGPAPAAAPVLLESRVHDLWITPHGVIKAALRNKATLEFHTHGGREVAVVSFTEQGKYAAKAFIGENYLVERVESLMPNAVLGDTPVVTTYENYHQYGGVRFPSRIRQSAGGYPVLDLAVGEVQPNAAVDLPVPEVVRGFTEKVASEKAADGVWYLAGASHHSVVIEMKDHVILVESPLYDGRATAVLQEAKRLVPGKPIRYVINSHYHFDHAGGLRAAAAEGATIVSQQGTKAWYEKALANPNRIQPDLLAKLGRKAKVVGAGERMVPQDGTRTVEIHHIQGSVHALPFLMVYLPKEKLLIEGDAYTPLAPNVNPPSPPNANNVNLVQNIDRLKLSVERILPLHGRMVPMSELNRAVGR